MVLNEQILHDWMLHGPSVKFLVEEFQSVGHTPFVTLALSFIPTVLWSSSCLGDISSDCGLQ